MLNIDLKNHLTFQIKLILRSNFTQCFFITVYLLLTLFWKMLLFGTFCSIFLCKCFVCLCFAGSFIFTVCCSVFFLWLQHVPLTRPTFFFLVCFFTLVCWSNFFFFHDFFYCAEIFYLHLDPSLSVIDSFIDWLIELKTFLNIWCLIGDIPEHISC